DGAVRDLVDDDVDVRVLFHELGGHLLLHRAFIAVGVAANADIGRARGRCGQSGSRGEGRGGETAPVRHVPPHESAGPAGPRSPTISTISATPSRPFGGASRVS